MANKLGVDNLVQIAVELIQVGKDVKEQLKDGFQILTDIPVIVFKDFGKIQDVATRYKSAWEEIKDLEHGELTAFKNAVAAQTGTAPGSVLEKLEEAIGIVDDIYGWVLTGVSIFKRIKTTFGKAA